MILVSSEHSFPFRLSDPRLGFNLSNFTEYIYAGEVPPNEMYKLLTTKWGVRDNLALALIDHFGGHIWDTYLALNRLNSDREEFIALDPQLGQDVVRCLKWEGNKEQMKMTLCQIAESGFSPLSDQDDPIAEVISKNNVGGVVKKRSTVVGLPLDAWGKSKIGLVPSKQSTRLAIAEVLEDYKI